MSPSRFTKNIPHLAFATLALGALFFSGCATTPMKLPADYSKGDHEVQVAIKRIPDKGVFRESGKGGMISAIAGLVRQSGLRDKMEGAQGKTVKELLIQALNRNLEEHFFVVETSKELVVEVEVTQWGWFLPTAMFGIKTGSYQFEVMGYVRVFDHKATDGKKPVAALMLISQEPIGDKPDPDRLQEIMLKVADKFAKQTCDVLLDRKPAPAK